MQELKVGGQCHAPPWNALSSPPSSRAEGCLAASVLTSFLSSRGSGCFGPSSVVEVIQC